MKPREALHWFGRYVELLRLPRPVVMVA